MKNQKLFLNKKKWQKEGFILQDPQGGYWVGQGPFSYSALAAPQTLYHPDFFLQKQSPWIKASLTSRLDPEGLAVFLSEGNPPIQDSELLKSRAQKADFVKNSKRISIPILKHSSQFKGPNAHRSSGWDPSKSTFSSGTHRSSGWNPLKITVRLDRLRDRDTAKSFQNQFFKNSKAPSFIQYQKIFFQARQAIHRGEFQKVVPTVFESFNFQSDLILCLKKLFTNTRWLSNGFLYGFWNKERGILGWTPEILFSVQRNKFWTIALAGTSPHPGPSLLKDKKELREHNFVVKGLQESLEGLVEWEKKLLSEMSVLSIKHLRTDLSGQLINNPDFEQLCHKLHPTPALGGYPREPAFDWLKNHSSQKGRVFFGAPFGFFHSTQKAFCLTAIRALEWSGREGRIFSGAGLIRESVLQKEWQELFLKRQQVKNFFQ